MPTNDCVGHSYARVVQVCRLLAGVIGPRSQLLAGGEVIELLSVCIRKAMTRRGSTRLFTLLRNGMDAALEFCSTPAPRPGIRALRWLGCARLAANAGITFFV